MTKQEFEERVHAKISDTRYMDIEFVYTWHPMIDNVKGKDQIAYLYNEFGMRIIYDMLPTAQRAMELEAEIKVAQDSLDELKQQYADLKGE